ncbi:threonine synthase [Syntrophomonas erecta]
MNYFSTRGRVEPVSASQAITMGIAPDGGLFVPQNIPRLPENIWQEMSEWSYQQRASYLMSFYLSDFTREEIEACVTGAYNAERFDHSEIAPLVELYPGVFIQELWHGPTAAFKDMALQILPRLLTTSMGKLGENSEIVILVATSGDTGKAALEGFRDVNNTRIIVFYPRDGVSEVQKQQMITQSGNNVYVAAVEGNFDDAQSGVKKIFADENIQQLLADHNMKMSSANSINWGRLLPQIVYYVSAYVDLIVDNRIRPGDEINIVVPTGNFGNILAAYYAREMGVPIRNLICASNANNVLTDFINTGIYDRNRYFEKTISPSMDILISSNLERLLYEVTSHDDRKVSEWMEELQTEGRYQVDPATHQKIKSLFRADFATDEETLATIKLGWDKYRYLLDTHTAVACNVYQKFLKHGGAQIPAVIASTASPFKFGSSVAKAVLSPEMRAGKDEFSLLRLLSTGTGLKIPAGIAGLEQRPVLHNKVTTTENMPATVLNLLNIKNK